MHAISTLLAAVCAASLDAAILQYRIDDASVAPTHWTGSPGPRIRLPAGAFRHGNSIAFDGRKSGPLLSALTDAASLHLPATSITVQAVFSIERAGEWGGVLGFLTDNGGIEQGWILGHHGPHFAFGLASAGANDGDGRMTYLESKLAWETGRLYFVAATYDGTAMRLYVNGEPQAESRAQSGAILYPARSALAFAGYRDSNENHPLCGRVTMVRLDATCLDAAAVREEAGRWHEAIEAPAVLTADLPRPVRETDLTTAGPRSSRDILLPINQRLTPAGRQLVLPKRRPQGLAAHPKGNYVVVSGSGGEILVVDPEKAAIRHKVPFPAGGSTATPPAADHILIQDDGSQMSLHGLIFSPAGDRLYLSNVSGDIKVFSAASDGKVAPLFSIPLPAVTNTTRRQEIPAGLATSADGRTLYAALNLSDQLAEIDAVSGTVRRLIAMGVAPHDVVIAGGKAYVSCRGGRRPGPGDLAGHAGRGTKVRMDPTIDATAEGSVSVVDLTSGKVVKELLTGLHASGLALHPRGRYLVVANANSDTVTVIDTRKDTIIEQIRLHWQPKGYFGASPNALCFSDDGDRLYVCNGTQNALAVVDFDPGESKLAGLIPVGWYPGAVALLSKSDTLAVANLKGLGSGAASELSGGTSFNSHEHSGTVNFIPAPARKELVAYTQQTMANCRQEVMEAASLPARAGQPLCAVPERVGEPSPFKHVIYVIKENRTYDQVMGDVPEGNGDPFLCIFGEQVTPNQHKLAREFVLLDNLYCCGVLSADGHQWATGAFANDYLEREFAGWPRSYPDFTDEGGHDLLANSPKGYIWDNALAHGVTVRTYGESSLKSTATWRDGRKGKPAWRDHLANLDGGSNAIAYFTTPGIVALKPHACTNTVGWLTSVPDVVRVDNFLREFRAFEANDTLPNLCLMTLPMNHTVGTGAGTPTPAATVADNDLAVGRLVEAVSHSRYWSNTVIFIVEDDPQAGWDHVSPYRTTAYVVSPYTRRRAVVSEHYSQNSILRTMELMLGLPPMNQLDAIAPPMRTCFTDSPDFTPFMATTNQIPLGQLNGQVSSITNPQLRRDAQLSARLPLERVDACPEDEFNRILWRAINGAEMPYPEWALLPPDERQDDDEDDA